jgi:glycosyltransferase involved in cell wall biosynthesis
MLIVYLSASGELGGAEISLLDMLASLRGAEPGWRLRLIVSENGPLVARAEALGVETIVLPFPESLARLGDAGAGGPAGHEQSRRALFGRLLWSAPALVSYVRRLRQALRESGPDVIHTNGFKMHILGVLANASSVPVIWHIHDYVSPRPLMARLLKRYSHRCALALANSRSVARDVEAVCGGGPLMVRTVYNGIDVESFSPVGPKLDLDALAGLAPASAETVRVGMLATLARWKGHRTFLHALTLLPAGLPVRAYVVGSALYRTNGSQHSLEDLKRLARRLGLAERVGFTGFLDRPAEAVRALDILVHASTEPEPFGLVIAEGMACGRAVIASQAGGAAELFEAEVNALGHTPGDAARLAERITQLVTDPALRARLGAAARLTAEQRFNRARLAEELIPLYRRVISSTN